MSVKDLLAVNGTGKRSPAGAVEAPELGDGAVLHVRRLTMGDRRLFVEIQKAEGRSAIDKQIDLLALVVCEPDGTPAWAYPPAPADQAAILTVPGSLADRLIMRAVELSGADADAAKKGSPPTPKP